VILTGGLRPGEVVAAGTMIGVFLLVLGITGWIGARAIPQSVSAGLQLGLGLLMAMLGLKLILETPWLGFGSFALLFALTRIPSCPTAPIALAAAMFAGWATGKVGIASWAISSRRLPMMHRHGWQGPRAPSNTCHAWFVWEERSTQKSVIHWFDWKDYPVPDLAPPARHARTALRRNRDDFDPVSQLTLF